MGDKLAILHLMLDISETSMPYNEFCKAQALTHEIGICTFFNIPAQVARRISIYPGDGTVRGFFRALDNAMKTKSYDIIHAHSPHVSNLLLSYRFSHRKFPPAIATVHNSYASFKLRNRLLWLPIFCCFDRIIACSQAAYNSFPRIYKSLAGGRFLTIRNGVDLARIDQAIHLEGNVYSQPDMGFTLLAVSRLIPIKRPFDILMSFASIQSPSTHLTFIGEGEMRESLQLEVEKLRLQSQVNLTGLIPREQVYQRMVESNAFISTSRGEGLPIAVLEAMACGCPIILSDIGPHRDIAQGVDFIPLVRVGDIQGFTDQIQHLMQLTPEERRLLGLNCRKLVEDNFSLQTMHSLYTQLYRSLL